MKWRDAAERFQPAVTMHAKAEDRPRVTAEMDAKNKAPRSPSAGVTPARRRGA
ncbi:hypothetical protein [Streptomyces sp. YKOK-I1]